MNEEMKEMLEVIQKYHSTLLRSSYERYFAPNIPDKIIKKLFN